ncbi:helix-turn-helix transcriptional regulator [Paraburkholderia diazotrophica]|uniref:helix-turn-helix transcriptional regulator n=1 Tax=Paraburkholderia diazotrophica TaxID=667676 RepID=UPI003D182FF9
MCMNSQKIVRGSEVARRFGVSRRTIDRWVSGGAFPAPLRLSERSRAAVWFEEDLIAHIAARAAARAST